MREKNDFLQFNDGIVDIYAVGNDAESGDMPSQALTLKYQALRFEFQTIGVRRNYEAMQADVKLSELIRIPIHREISSQDIAVMNGLQYEIVQVQHDTGTRPSSSKLSLARLEVDYDLSRIQKYSS